MVYHLPPSTSAEFSRSDPDARTREVIQQVLDLDLPGVTIYEVVEKARKRGAPGTSFENVAAVLDEVRPGWDPLSF